MVLVSFFPVMLRTLVCYGVLSGGCWVAEYGFILCLWWFVRLLIFYWIGFLGFLRLHRPLPLFAWVPDPCRCCLPWRVLSGSGLRKIAPILRRLSGWRILNWLWFCCFQRWFCIRPGWRNRRCPHRVGWFFFRSMVLSPAKAGALISRQRSKAVFFMKCLYEWVFFRRFDGQTALWFGVMC